MQNQNPAGANEISPKEAWRRLQDEDAILVDVREADEVALAAVPGSVHIPLGQFGQRAGALPRDRDLLLFCYSGGRSAFATEILNENGFPRAFNVSGGLLAWMQERLPLE
jgi:rhodanese-related sulfurtransferase